ncbi:MAG: circularly permuted type 2 ATP-grasp protein, partial [Opitutales bacterium]
LPPQLVLGNPAFLRPCHGLTPPDGIFINVYAADLARSPDGQWWVLSDRLDAPSGIGYALENRTLTTRVLSDWQRDLRVARLEGFFQTLRTSFEKLVARRTESPRIVLLTPGPANETYFEHSFLARNQGFPLVEGGDLIVRSDRVYLKTLAGLRPVDLILRRVDSDFCDPLELRSDSLLGVPGLLQSARAGRVALANGLGAGLLESAGLSPFLPALCRHLLGEELKMPSVATWWCGQPHELNYVLEHLDELILQPPVPQTNPPKFVGPPLTPRASARRSSFLVANGSEYHAMPGGLARIPAEADLISVSMQRGGLSKDTWVLPPPEKPTLFETTTPPAGPVKLRRQTADLPSRVAENLFWLGRYLERADGQARVLRVLASVLTEEGTATDPATIRPLFQTLLPGEPLPVLISGNPPVFDLAAAERSLRSLLWNTKLSCSLAVNSTRLEKSAYRVKERLSGDAWNLVSRLQRLRRPSPEAVAPGGDLHTELADIIVLLSAISGLIMENITRGYGWRFLDLGSSPPRCRPRCSTISCCPATACSPTAAATSPISTSFPCSICSRATTPIPVPSPFN